jgi:hypothetical protein
MNIGPELIQWLVNQGVAVAFGIYVLVRLDTRIGELLLSVQKLTDALAAGQATK